MRALRALEKGCSDLGGVKLELDLALVPEAEAARLDPGVDVLQETEVVEVVGH